MLTPSSIKTLPTAYLKQPFYLVGHPSLEELRPRVAPRVVQRREREEIGHRKPEPPLVQRIVLLKRGTDRYEDVQDAMRVKNRQPRHGWSGQARSMGRGKLAGVATASGSLERLVRNKQAYKRGVSRLKKAHNSRGSAQTQKYDSHNGYLDSARLTAPASPPPPHRSSHHKPPHRTPPHRTPPHPTLSLLTLLMCRSARLFPSAAWFPGRMGPKGTSFRCSRIMNAPGPMSPTLFYVVVFFQSIHSHRQCHFLFDPGWKRWYVCTAYIRL